MIIKRNHKRKHCASARHNKWATRQQWASQDQQVWLKQLRVLKLEQINGVQVSNGLLMHMDHTISHHSCVNTCDAISPSTLQASTTEPSTWPRICSRFLPTKGQSFPAAVAWKWWSGVRVRVRHQGCYSNPMVGDAPVHVLQIKRKWEQWEMEDNDISSKNSEMLFQIWEILTSVGKDVCLYIKICSISSLPTLVSNSFNNQSEFRLRLGHQIDSWRQHDTCIISLIQHMHSGIYG